jgi:hypothetical protein
MYCHVEETLPYSGGKPILRDQIPLDYSDPKLYKKPVVHTRERVGLFWFLKPNKDKVVPVVTDAE